ncbi:MAG: winged helix-turn-helix domain-containing protein [Chloroflexota bacterium]
MKASASALAEPVPSRTIADVETLKALADPVRIRILEAMCSHPIQDWTVKHIAKALGTGPTKLYHHIRILEERELIHPSGQQLVRGIVETSYRTAQLELRLDRAFLSSTSDEVRSTAHAALLSVFDLARQDLEAAVQGGLVAADGVGPLAGPFILTRTLIRTTHARSIELRERMQSLLHEYADDSSGDMTLAVLVSLHPVAVPAGDAEPDGDPEPGGSDAG